MNAVLVVLAVVVLIPGAATALHLGLLAVGSLLYRVPPKPASVPPVRFLILVPAYNEEKVIGDTLDALTADMRPRDQLVVVADRCTDATASIARAAGALVLERGADEEPGRAAARQAGVEYAMTLEWDAIVMVDADSIIERGFFDECEAALARGAEALQGRSEAAIGTSLLDQAGLASFAMQGVLMPRGRSRLHLLVRLRGTGMVLTRRIVSQYEFRAAASEDLWYSLDLCLAGIRPAHVETARLRSLNVATWEAAGDQRIRYEAGRMSAAREFARPLLRRHDLASIEAAWFLLTPPFAGRGVLRRRRGRAGVARGRHGARVRRARLPRVARRHPRGRAGAGGSGRAHVAGSRDRAVVRALEGGHPDPRVAPAQDAGSRVRRHAPLIRACRYCRAQLVTTAIKPVS